MSGCAEASHCWSSGSRTFIELTFQVATTGKVLAFRDAERFPAAAAGFHIGNLLDNEPLFTDLVQEIHRRAVDEAERYGVDNQRAAITKAQIRRFNSARGEGDIKTGATARIDGQPYRLTMPGYVICKRALRLRRYRQDMCHSCDIGRDGSQEKSESGLGLILA